MHVGIIALERPVAINLLKSVLHNVGVVIGSLGLAYLGIIIDSSLGIPRFTSSLVTAFGVLLVICGFLLRVWATTHFYAHKMRVISLQPQNSLITTGPYHYSRNPLYLGGNVFCFFGAALLLGSPTAVLLTILHLPFVDLMIRREEKQLQREFGEDFRIYKSKVRRWF